MSEIVYCRQAKNIIEAGKISLERIIPHAVHWSDFAYACSEAYKYQLAKNAFYKSLDLSPLVAENWIKLGWIHRKLQEPAKAVEVYQKAITLQPDNLQVWGELINLYVQLKRYKKAQNAYENILQLQPHDAQLWNSFGNLLSDKLKDFNKAIACFDKVIELDKGAYWAIFNKGLAYRKMECYEDAIVWFRKSLEIKPDYTESWNSLGTCYLNMRQFEEAEKCYQFNLDNNPYYSSSIYNMGCLYAVKGNKKQALHFLTQALEKDHTDHFVAWAPQDTDFESLWQDVDFMALIEKYKGRVVPF
jgi:tetratricopeptide (TPR) repeat protein